MDGVPGMEDDGVKSLLSTPVWDLRFPTIETIISSMSFLDVAGI
jgi:hypothetical protein